MIIVLAVIALACVAVIVWAAPEVIRQHRAHVDMRKLTLAWAHTAALLPLAADNLTEGLRRIGIAASEVVGALEELARVLNLDSEGTQ